MENTVDLASLLESFKSPSSVVLLFYLVGMSLAPFVAVMVTSYIKIVVVIHLLRNALGVQQIPPNLAVNGLAIILSAYVMAPVASEVARVFGVSGFDVVAPPAEDLFTLLSQAAQPVTEFLIANSDQAQRDFFLRATTELWPDDFAAGVSERNLLILIPAFTLSELKAAFEIGFLLYMPFVAIDLIVSNVLLAMGMMMVSPMTISLPFKLLLFVVIDGWTKLLQGLVMSYS